MRNPISLKSFVSKVLTEGVLFADKTIPQTFTATTTKASPPSSADVKSSKRKIAASEILNGIKSERGLDFAQSWRDEFWFARKSVHEPKEDMGTASWKEFVNGLLVNHSKNEADYTPNVFDCQCVCEWEGEELSQVEGFEDVRMSSRHFPLPT